MDKVIPELKLNVVGQCSHQFERNNASYGSTMIYLLSQIHLSLHTFVEEEKIILDSFTCS